MKELLGKVLITFQDGAVLTVGHLLSATTVLVLGLLLSAWVSRAVDRRVTSRQFSPDAAPIARKLVFILMAVITIMFTLNILSVPITAFTFLSGAVAIGFGFGAQNIINNLISGWILMTERPVRIGDIIELGESKGVVERIGNRSTRIKRVDGVHIMIPNSLLMENTVINWTLVDREIRTTVTVGVAYGSPVRKVEALIQQVLSGHPLILKEPAPSILFSDFGDSALIFEAMFWCRVVSGERDLRVVRSDVRYSIDELFRQHDITIAFPQLDLHIKSTPQAGSP